MERTIVIFGKPPNVPHARTLLSFIWGRRFPLSHWALLVTPLDVPHLLNTIKTSHDPKFWFGTMFELSVGERNVPTLKSRRVNPDIFRLQWSENVYEYIGTTNLADYEIVKEGTAFHELN
jgi:hypothetical protein